AATGQLARRTQGAPASATPCAPGLLAGALEKAPTNIPCCGRDRHTSVSVMSSKGISVEQIADVVGHANANITRAVYRHQIGDVVAGAAAAWDSFTASPQAPAKGSSRRIGSRIGSRSLRRLPQTGP